MKFSILSVLSLFHLGRHMAVHIQSKGSGGVAQVFLHRLNVIPALNCHDRVGMLQVVELGVEEKLPFPAYQGRKKSLVPSGPGIFCFFSPQAPCFSCVERLK